MARSHQRRWSIPRIAAYILALVVLLVGLCLTALWLAYENPEIRQRVLDRVETEVLTRTGLQLEIGDFLFKFRRAVIRLEDVRLSSPDAAPILAARFVEIRPSLSTLLGREVDLRELRLGGPRLDLHQPIPELATTHETSEGEFSFTLGHFTLYDGEIDAPVMPGPVKHWISDWWIEDLRLEGHYGPEDLEVELHGLPRWLRSDGKDVQLDLYAHLEGTPQGPLRVSKLSLQGDGLQAVATANFTFDQPERGQTSFQVAIQPSELLPVSSTEGPIQLQGNLDLFPLAGSLQMSGRGLSSQLLDPWLDPEKDLDPVIEAMRLDFETDLSIEPAETVEILGHVNVAASLHDELLLKGRVETVEPLTDGESASLWFEAEVLPQADGQRQLRGGLSAPDWTQLADGSLHDGSLRVETPELSELLTKIEQLLAFALPAQAHEMLSGPFELDAAFEGPLLEPQLELTAAWRPGPDLLPVEGLPFQVAQISAEMRDGTIQATVEASGHCAETGRLDIVAPLASLASVPALEDLTVLENLEQASGPLRMMWNLPTADWSPILATLDDPIALERLELATHGRFELDPIRPLAATAELTVEGLVLEAPDWMITGSAPLRISIGGGTVSLEPTALRFEEALVTVEAETQIDEHWQPGESWREIPNGISVAARGALPAQMVADVVPDVTASGTLEIDAALIGSLDQLSGNVRVEGHEAVLLFDQLEGVPLTSPRIHIELDQNLLHLAEASFELDGRPVSLNGEASLESLDPPVLADRVSLQLRIPDSDWASLLENLGVEEPPDLLTAGVIVDLDLDLGQPAMSVGALEITGLATEIEGHHIAADAALRLNLEEGALVFEVLRLVAGEQELGLAGRLELQREWSRGDEPLDLVNRLEIEGTGILDSTVLNPFLAGGASTGLIDLDFNVSGNLDELVGHIWASGPEASILFVSPYMAKIDQPELEIEVADGVATVLSGSLLLNDGRVDLAGTLSLEGVQLSASLDGLRFLLDYGLFAVIDGELQLDLAEDFSGKLSGELIVDRGSLTRSINIEQELLTQLLLPIDMTGSEPSPLEQIELDIELTTRHGVRVSNNVGDLLVRWEPIAVRNHLLQPVLDGAFEVEPGGRVFLFGQTVRIDEGTLKFPGQLGAEAELVLETTTLADDPSILQLTGDDPLAGSTSPETGASRAEAMAAGVATYYGDRIAARVGEALGGTVISFRPIQVFGETDPNTRLTVARDFSRYVTLAASLDLRNAERQTYLLDAHDLPRLPTLRAQLFTKEEGGAQQLAGSGSSDGATLQQQFQWGGSRKDAATGPRIRQIHLDPIPGTSKRGIRKALALEKGGRLSEDDLFIAEIEVGEYLRRRGYPDARVALRSTEVADRDDKIDLQLEINPGPRVSFLFEGESISKPLQRSITSLYRTDFYEALALEEMHSQTVRALRSLGFSQPQVDIAVAKGEFQSEPFDRLVSVRTIGGNRLPLDELALVGLTTEEAERVTLSFTSRVQKLELAMGEPEAERRLLAALETLGYPMAQIQSTTISSNSKTVTVGVEPGRPVLLSAVSLSGLEGSEAEYLLASTHLRPGDIARGDRIALAALSIEDELAQKGYRDARVLPRISTAAEAGEPEVALDFDVDPGRQHTLSEANFEGLRSTRQKWTTSVADLEAGAVLRDSDVGSARRRLYETGLFSVVDARAETDETGDSKVVFAIEERPRFSVAYGLRWDNENGLSAVVDAIDGNLLGRGLILGLRAIYASDDQSVRLSGGVPRLLGTRASLELFGSVRNRVDELFDEDFNEASLQVSYPVSARWIGRAYGRYRYFEAREVDPILPEFPLMIRASRPFLGTQWIFDSRNREVVFTRGLFASIDLSGTDDSLDSDFKWIRSYGQINSYLPVGRWLGRRFHFAQSTRVGLADSFDQEMDRVDRFFAGGQFSVRGYPTESLGPQEVLGDFVRPLGGEAVAVLNQELRFDLYDPVAALLFLDLGNVWETASDIELDFFKSLGIGVRAVTPVGLLRLDVGFPLDRRNDDASYKIYFGFGNAF